MSFTFGCLYYRRLMSKRSQRFRWLAQQLDVLVEDLNKSPSLDERKRLLMRMKVLIDEIDKLAFSALKRDGNDATTSPSPD